MNSFFSQYCSCFIESERDHSVIKKREMMRENVAHSRRANVLFYINLDFKKSLGLDDSLT